MIEVLFYFNQIFVFDKILQNSRIINIEVIFIINYRPCMSGEYIKFGICDYCLDKTYTMKNNSI